MKSKLLIFGCIVEIKIPVKKLKQGVTDTQVKKYASRVINNLMQQLREFNGYDIYETTGFVGVDDLTEINDFDYSCYNEVEKDNEFFTFRSFNHTIYTIVPEGKIIDVKEQFGKQVYSKIAGYKGILLNVIQASFAERKNRNV